jgi:hypothetical protein
MGKIKHPPKTITTLNDFVNYLTTEDSFRNPSQRKKIKDLLQIAHDMFKFETDGYWKRASYFWGFSVVAFTAYFLVADSSKFKDRPELLLTVNSLGLVFSFSWYMVNKGGKYWMNNWYFIIGAIEKSLGTPLYSLKRTPKHSLFSPLGAYPISFTKINQMVCLYINAIWIGLIFIYLNKHYIEFYNKNIDPWLNCWDCLCSLCHDLLTGKNIVDTIILLITFCAIATMFFLSHTETRANEIKFRITET